MALAIVGETSASKPLSTRFLPGSQKSTINQGRVSLHHQLPSLSNPFMIQDLLLLTGGEEAAKTYLSKKYLQA